MKKSNIFLAIFGLFGYFLESTNGLKCPMTSVQKSVNRFDHICWDGSSPMLGCCFTGTCRKSIFGYTCNCDTRCKGWSVDLAYEANFPFKEEEEGRLSYEKDNNESVFSTYGNEDQCKKRMDNKMAISARANHNSCVKLWEKAECIGNHITLKGGKIPDVRVKGLPEGVSGVSGCDFIVTRKSVEVKLYQHAFWRLFGSSETIVVNPGQCKFVGDWWKDRVSMIDPRTDDCYKIWENKDCTGAFFCDCGKASFALVQITLEGKRNDLTGSGETTWNNHARALSLCSYSDLE